ncbi:AmmeMemoRadiSam system radical SAM enzyme [Candidatus Undinarchaeota archaeon]
MPDALHEAKYYTKSADSSVDCQLCPHHCKIQEGKRGLCRVRENQGGKLFSMNYGKLVSMNVDPIEKKPLFHFYPGTQTLSIATTGCNMRCQFCQNWQISQAEPESLSFDEVPPEKVVEMAKSQGLGHISYTYTEPTIFYEYAFDVAKLAHKEGIKNSFVSNGFIEEQPLRDLAPYLDAMNMDFKMTNKANYKKYCGADAFDVVQRTAKLCKELGIHLEITTLIVPELNDNPKELEYIFDFIAGIDKDIPLHLSRFHPDYKMLDAQITPLETLISAANLAKERLNYVYVGNTPEYPAENTLCPKCDTLIIKRSSFSVLSNALDEGKCPKCGEKIPIKWQEQK